MQTIWAARIRQPVKLDLETERLELPDGDFVDVHWSRTTHKPIVCLFHGLAGSVHSVYINRMIALLEDAGFRPVLMHFRGCSGEPNRLAKTYHSGHTEDIRFFIDTVAARFPESPLQTIGYSLGANALLKYLGEQGGDCPLRYAIAISPPLVLHEGANRMTKGLSTIYQKYLLKMMRAQHEDKRARHPQLELPEASSQLDTFWEFDDQITAPLNGFEDVHDYYTKCSSRQFLRSIEIRTHILHSRDDPFFTPAVIPAEDELATGVTLELTRRGGHVAFVSGANPLKAEYWMEKRLLELLRENADQDQTPE